MKVTKPPRGAESGMDNIEVEDVVTALSDVLMMNPSDGAADGASRHM
jgi:hypothetical protein